jgi:hypothetical protein
MLRKLFLVIILLVAGACFGKEELNVDVSWGWGGCYRPMEWTPVEIGISSSAKEAFGGTLIISAPQDSLNTMNINHRFALTPGLPLNIPLVAKLAFASQQGTVTIIDENGRTHWSHSFELWNFSRQSSPLTVVNEADFLIGVVGRRKFGLASFSDKVISKSAKNSGTVYVKDKLERLIPWDWTGYVSLDLLILYDPDWSLFNKEQLNAVSRWVSNGGRLLVILGSNQLLPDNPLSNLLPFEIQQPKQTTIAADTLKNLGLNPQNDESAVCSLFRPKPDANFTSQVHKIGGDCLYATASVGFGRIGILALDPSGLSANHSADSVQFWLNIIKPLIDSKNTPDVQKPASSSLKGSRRSDAIESDTAFDRTIQLKDDNQNNQTAPDHNYYYTISLAQAGSNVVMEHLYHISQLRPLSIWWIILLLIIFALLLGPVDYIVLKRLDRLPLTWLTTSCWILIFSVGAYYGVAAVRGGKMMLRVVSVIDGIQNSNHNWATSYSGLFAPYSADYKLDALSDKQWWSALAPSDEQLYSYQRNVVGRNIYCEQSDGKNHPFSIPISIWSMQCLLTESPLDKMPVDALVKIEGDNVTIKIDNRSTAPVKQGYVLFAGNRALNFGKIAPGSSGEFTGSLELFTGWPSVSNLRYRNYIPANETEISFHSETAFFAQGTLQRTRAINNYLQQGAAVVCLEFDQHPVSFKIKDRSYLTDHIQLVRLVVSPEIIK